MSPTALATARGNAVDTLETCLGAVASGREREPELLASIAERYRLLAIAVLLADADVEGFATLLALSGQTECRLRDLDLSTCPARRIASRAGPFCDALAAGDLEAARRIARRSPSEPLAGWEYEDDFLRARVLHALVLGSSDAELEALALRWEQVLDGAPSVHLEALRALIARDPAAFDAALRGIADERRAKLDAWRKMPIYDEQIEATEGAILVAGLALLRLAELRGVATPDEHPYMPSIARVPLGATLPAPESWRDARFALSFA